MIIMDLTLDENQLAHQVVCKARFYQRKPITIKHAGTSEELRAKLRPEYLAHLHIILDDFTIYCQATENPALKNEIERIHETQRQHLHGCHVALAKDLLLRKEDLEDILPNTESHDRAKHMLRFTLETIEQLATEQESLWVRGAIDTLTSGLIYPWSEPKKAA
jgi:hypothetical protein